MCNRQKKAKLVIMSDVADAFSGKFEIKMGRSCVYLGVSGKQGDVS